MAVLALALAGVLLALSACTNSPTARGPMGTAPQRATAGAPPVATSPALQSTADNSAVGAQLTRDAAGGVLLQMTIDAAHTAAYEEGNRRATVAAIEGMQTTWAITAQAATVQAQQTQNSERMTSTAQALAMAGTTQAREQETASAAQSATVVIQATQAEQDRRIAAAQTARAEQLAQANAQATAQALQAKQQGEQQTAMGWTILTWVVIATMCIICALAVVFSWRAFHTWDRRRRFIDPGNGQPVYDAGNGRLVDMARAAGPVVDVNAQLPAPVSERTQARVTAQALFVAGWIESARATARAIVAGAGPAQAGKSAARAGASPALPDGGAAVFTPPITDEAERPPVIVIEDPGQAQHVLPAAQWHVLQADWSKGHDNTSD